MGDLVLTPPTPGDVPQLASMLARSFDTCPAWRWYLPPESPRRLERMERFFAFLLSRFYVDREDRQCVVPGDRTGALLLDPPGGWELGTAESARGLAAMVPVFRRHTPRAARGFSAFDSVHPKRPHYYVSVLGVAPEARRSGLAETLVRHAIERCDREQVGAYAETGRPGTRDFYLRAGFEVAQEMALPGGGPPVWTLWREPGV